MGFVGGGLANQLTVLLCSCLSNDCKDSVSVQKNNVIGW